MYRHTCDTPYFRGEPVEEAVWQWLKTLLIDSEMPEMGLRAQQTDTENRDAPVRERLNGIDRQISTCPDQQERLLDLYLANKLPMETWDARNLALKDEIAALLAEKATQEGKLEIR